MDWQGNLVMKSISFNHYDRPSMKPNDLLKQHIDVSYYHYQPTNNHEYE